MLGSTKKDVDKDKDGEKVPKLESVEVFIVYCNLVKNDYQPTSYVLFTLSQINNLDSYNKYFITFFNDDEHRIEDNVNLTLIIG